MRTSPDGIDFIRREEGVRLKAYRDVVGVWTIGIGHTGTDVHPDSVLASVAEADALLRKDLERFEYAVDRAIGVPQVTQGQFDAMVSLAFNIGAKAFADSTLVKRFNRGDVQGACTEFVRWNKAGGVLNEGLLKRRAREAWVFARSSP